MQPPPLPPPPMQMSNAPASTFPTAPVTTEQIQKLLDENKQLIIMILENQNLGKLAECARYQALLQKNLVYLAAIADAQPQVQLQPVLPQTPIQPALQQGQFIQHPQHMMMTPQQPNMSTSVIPQHFTNQMQFIQSPIGQQQQQQLFMGQLGFRPGIQTQPSMHQMSPSGMLDPNSFSNTLRARHNFSSRFGSDIQGKDLGGNKES